MSERIYKTERRRGAPPTPRNCDHCREPLPLRDNQDRRRFCPGKPCGKAVQRGRQREACRAQDRQGGPQGRVQLPWHRSDSMRPLYIVPCSATKSPLLADGRRMPARDAYCGQAFRMLRPRLEAARCRWCILSGWYGILWPDTLIEAYEHKMEPVVPGMSWDGGLDAIKQKQYGRLATAERVIVLGSRLYASNAEWLLDRPVESPLAGLPIGRMLAAIRTLELSGNV